MQQYGDVGILEEAGAHEIGPAHELLLGGTDRDRDASRNVVALHRLLDGIGGADRDAGMGVVSLHVAGRADNQRLALDAAGGLRAARQRVHLGHDHDLRLAGAPMGPDVRLHAGGTGLDRETDQFEHALDEFRAFELLHAEFAEIVDGVADRGDLLGIALDHFIGERLGAVGLGAHRDGQRGKAAEEGGGSHHPSRYLHCHDSRSLSAAAAARRVAAGGNGDRPWR